ncbi:MAG: hypothetical protein B6245_17895 [Desulfobacteraceae bacterium 4572_88]|nr:MAG: hypothetical protein B6245_17895 [Desulfobacteraceae bacterium 4572_88]
MEIGKRIPPDCHFPKGLHKNREDGNICIPFRENFILSVICPGVITQGRNMKPLRGDVWEDD